MSNPRSGNTEGIGEVHINDIIMEKCDIQKKRGLSPLHVAASQGNEELVLSLLQNGNSPTVTDRLGNTPLHYCGHKEIAACLLEWGADTMTRLGQIKFAELNFLTGGPLWCFRVIGTF